VGEYERREPEKTLLHEVVREQLEGFLASSSFREQPAPRFIEQELRVRSGPTMRTDPSMSDGHRPAISRSKSRSPCPWKRFRVRRLT